MGYCNKRSQAEIIENELPFANDMLNLLQSFKLEYMVEVIYFPYEDYKVSIQNIMSMKTLDTFGKNTNLDGLLLVPSTKSGLCALLFTNAQNQVSLNEAASCVELEKVCYSEYRNLSNIEFFLQAKKDYPFVGDQIFWKKNVWVRIPSYGTNTNSVNIGKELPIRSYLSCDDKVSNIAIALNVLSKQTIYVFLCLCDQTIYLFVLYKLHSNWIIEKYQALSKKDGYPFTLFDTSIMFEILVPCNFTGLNNNIFGVLVGNSEEEIEKYMKVSSKECYQHFVDNGCRTINCGGGMMNKLIDCVFDANANYFKLKQGPENREYVDLDELTM